MTKSLRFALLSFVIAGFTTGIVAAQKKSEGSMQCRESRENDRLSSHCEIKEQTLPAGGAITVDGKTNGGISIKGWERNEILVRAKIETRAPTQAEADQLGQQVRIETGALNIRAEGPAPRDDYQWYVSYEIFVPRRSDLSLQAHNGGISITDVNGRIDFKTLNGGVNLVRVGGNVQAAMAIRAPKPSYPPLAKQARIQGVVRLNAIIGKDGTIQDLKAASGHPLLVPAALEAVKQWLYKPTLLNGEPVEVVTVIDVNFTLSQ